MKKYNGKMSFDYPRKVFGRKPAPRSSPIVVDVLQGTSEHKKWLSINAHENKLIKDSEAIVQAETEKKYYILVSKALYYDVKRLHEHLMTLKTSIKYVKKTGGFLTKIRSHVYSRYASRLIYSIRGHLLHMGIAPPSYSSYEQFLNNVVNSVPELTFLNNNKITVEYTSSYQFKINRVAVYIDKYFVNKVQEVWIEGDFGSLPNKPFKNYLFYNLNYFKMDNKDYSEKAAVEAKKLTIKQQKMADKEYNRKLSKAIKIRMTHKNTKANITKFNLADNVFPNLENDQPFKKKVVNNVLKHFTRSTIKDVKPKGFKEALLKPKPKSFARSDKAQEKKDFAPIKPKMNQFEQRLETTLDTLHQYKCCLRCALAKTTKQFPQAQVRYILKENKKCTCPERGPLVAQSDTPSPAEQMSISMAENICKMTDKQKKELVKILKDRNFFIKDSDVWGKASKNLQEAMSTLNTPKATTLNTLIALKEILTSEAIKNVLDPSTIDKLLSKKLIEKEDIEGLKVIAEVIEKVSVNLKDGLGSVAQVYHGNTQHSNNITRLSKVCGILLSIPLYIGLNNVDRMMLFASQMLLLDMPQNVYFAFKKLYYGSIALAEVNSEFGKHALVHQKNINAKLALEKRAQTNSGQVHAEADVKEEGDFASLVGPMSQLISLGMVSMTATSDSTSVNKIIKAGNIARSVTSVKSLSEAVKKGLEESQKHLFTIITGLPPDLQNLEETYSGLTEWMDLVKDTIENPSWLASYLDDPSNQEVLEELIKAGDLLYLSVLKGADGEAAHLKSYMTKALGLLRRYSTALIAARAGSKDRILPVSVLLHGPPGIGKTYTINQLVVDLFAKQPESYRKQYTSLEQIKYTKSDASDFYDGYLNHFAYVQDEIFSSTIKEEMSADCKKIMDMIQESSAPLNMAAVESKGKVNFQSRYVMFTTNKTDLKASLPVVEAGAITRRMHFCITIAIHPEFLAGDKLDVEKWTAAAKMAGLPSHIPYYATYQVSKLVDGKRAVQHCTYKELVDMLHLAHEENKVRFEHVHEQQQKVFSEYVPLKACDMFKVSDDSRFPKPIVTEGDSEDCPSNCRREDCKLNHTLGACAKERPQKTIVFSRSKSPPRGTFTQKDMLKNWQDVMREDEKREQEQVLKEAQKLIAEVNVAQEKIEKLLPATKPKEEPVLPNNPSVQDISKEESKKPSSIDRVREKLAGMAQKIAFKKLTGLENIQAQVAWSQLGEGNEEAAKWMEVCDLRSQDELSLFYFFSLTLKDKWSLEKAMTRAIGRSYTIPDGIKLINPQTGCIDKSIPKLIQEELKLPISSRFHMVWRLFMRRIREHPWISLLIGGSLMGLVTMGIMAMAQNYQKDRACPEALTYTSKASKRTSMRTTTNNLNSQGEIDLMFNGFELNTLVHDPVEDLFQAEEQAQVDQNWESQMGKVVSNLLVVRVATDLGFEVNRTNIRGIALQNDFALLPRHTFNNVPIETGYIKVKRGGIDMQFKLSDLMIEEIGERHSYNDAVIIKFPRGKFTGIRPIVDLFCTLKEVTTFADGWGELLIPDMVEKIIYRHGTRIETKFSPVSVTDSSKVMSKGYLYNAATKKGDCGSPLIRWDPRSRGKILGIHAAGRQDGSCEGYACIVDKDWITSCIRTMGEGVVQFSDEEITPLHSSSPELVEQMDIIGHSSNRVRLPLGETVYIPSIFAKWNFGVPKTAPAVRTAMGEDSSLVKVLKKFKKSAPYVDRKLVKQITTTIAAQFFMRGDRCRKIFTYTESLNVLDNIRSIDLSTSMGYPWNRKQLRKDNFVKYNEEEQKFEFLNSEIEDRCIENERGMRENLGREFVFVNCLKDERLPLEAVERGKVRLFMICPFDLTLMVRKFYGSFMEKIHSLKFDLGVCVGIDPHSEDWHFLAMRLKDHNEEMIAVDFSNWDRSIPIEFLSIFFDLADLYYSDEHKPIRDHLRYAILSPTYQLKYFRYKVVAGNPSGCPVTTELNSIANLGMTLYVITRLGFSLQQVFEHTFVATYGDDSVISTSLDVDIEDLKLEIADLGLIATSSVKSRSITKEPLCNIQFLKRNFLFYGGKFYAPLIMDTIMESLLWAKRGNNQHYNFKCTIENALVELEQYPIREVTEHYYKILDFAQRANFKVNISAHCIASLQCNTQCESASHFENFAIKAGLFFYRKLEIIKIVATRKDFIDLNVGHYVGIDIGKRVPLVTEGTFFHVGFRMMNHSESRIMELTFSDKGVAWIEAQYEPDFSFPIMFTKKQLLSNFSTNTYHLARYNCITWCEEVLTNTGQIANIDTAYTSLYKAFVRKTQADNGFLWEEGDTLTSSNIETLPIVFMSEQQMTSGQEQRSMSSLLGTNALIKQLEWTNNQVYDYDLSEIKIPGALHVVKQFECKLKFTALLKADIKIVLEVASNRLYSGSLIATWVPCASEGFPKGMKLTGKQMTGMQHAILMLPEVSSIEMIIPFNHFKNFISQTSYEDNEIGSLYIKVLNPLLSPEGGSNSVYVKILANYINVQAIISTPLSTQSKWDAGEDVFPRFLKQQGDEMEEKTEQGVISGIATSVGAVADIVGGIPVLSGVASTVSVISRGVAGIAKYMGLSKPRSLAITRPVIPKVFPNVGYSDAQDNGTVLGYDPKNHVVIQPSLFGSNQDQMNLNFLIQKPVLIFMKPWSSEHSINKTLITIPVHPFIGSKHIVAGHEDRVVQMSYLGYVASVFKYWRGDISLTFEIVATGLHSGSLVVAFIPNGTLQGDNKVEYETTIKEIIEVDGYSRKTITIPFVSTAMMNKVGCPFDAIDLKDDVATGTVVLKVDKPLLKTGVVSDKIWINIWVHGEQDFSFSFPNLDCLSKLGYLKNAHSLEEQSDFPDVQPTTNKRLDLVIGEEILSIRDLLKVSTLKFTTTKTFNHGTSQIAFPAHTFTGNANRSEVFDTFYTHFMRLYRFSRGGIRHKVMFGKMDAKVSAIALASPADEYLWTSFRTLEGAPWCTTHGEIAPFLEYEIPFYSRYKMEVHGESASERMAVVQFERFDTKPQMNKLLLYESIGDDFSAGYLMGPPVLYQEFGPLYKFMEAIHNTTMNGKTVKLVDDYYKPDLIKSKGMVKSTHWKEIEFYQQQFYYTDYLQKYTLLTADLDMAGLVDVSSNNANPFGKDVSTAFCFIRRDDAIYTKTQYSYNAEHCPFNGTWLGVHARSTFRIYAFSGLATRNLYDPKLGKEVTIVPHLKNVRMTNPHVDVLTNLLGSSNTKGVVTVTYE